MASKTLCRTCLRALRSEHHNEFAQARPLTPARSIAAAKSSATSIRYTRPFYSTPASRAQLTEHNRPDTPPKPQNYKSSHANPMTNLAASLRSSGALKGTTEPYIAYGSTEVLYRTCAAQCDYTVPNILKEPPEPAPRNAADEDIGEGTGIWFDPKSAGGMGLDVTFNTWAQVMYLHMYVLTVRLRCFPAEHARTWHQQLLDHFFYAAEDRMAVWHGMSSRSVRNRNLKDLWQQWRGVLFSYDEGLIRGDAVLAAAVWRNLFKARKDVEIADLALVTAYLRSQLQMLEKLSDQRLGSGEVKFGSLNDVKKIVDKESPRMLEGFGDKELEGVRRSGAEQEKERSSW